MQPRLNSISTFEMPAGELRQWAKTEVRPKALLAARGEGEFCAGEWCRFCKAKYTCRKRSEYHMRLAERVIKRAVKIDNRPLTVDDILEKVCAHFNVTTQNVFSRSRKRDYVLTRQISMYFAQKYTKMPASRIGQLIGNRDHSTVIHSCSTIEKRLKVDKAFVEEMNSIENAFRLKK